MQYLQNLKSERGNANAETLDEDGLNPNVSSLSGNYSMVSSRL